MKYVFFDIDFTLFDCRKFERMVFAKLKKDLFSFSLRALKKDLKAARHFITTTPEKIDASQLTGSFLDPAYYQKALFPDALPALQALKNTAKLGAWSEANPKKQMIKLKLSGLINFFEPELLYLSRRKFRLVKKIVDSCGLENVIFVDNKPKLIKKLSGLGIQSFLIDRFNTQPAKVPTIRTLASLPDLPILFSEKK
ncbi:MAG: hypothetical protein Q8N16_02595 [bacterium]|nr:hypothetical protein [bacterium]